MSIAYEQQARKTVPEPLGGETHAEFSARLAGFDVQKLHEADLYDHGDGRMDPGYARIWLASIIVSLLAMWGTVDLVLHAIAWWWS